MRLATKQDLPALTQLWTQCFGDPPAVVRHFFDTLWTHIRVYLSEDRTAMLTALPVRWKNRDTAYLYAVATHSEFRGQGLCRNLMSYAEQDLQKQGYSYTTLCPAEASLYSFYQSMGYKTTFYATSKMFHGKHSGLVQTVSPETYAILRKNYTPDGVEYPDCLLALQAQSGRLVKIDMLGCAALEQTETGWIVRELLSHTPSQAAQILCAYLNLDEILCRMPGSDPFAMAKSLDGSPLTPSYLGFAFE